MNKKEKNNMTTHMKWPWRELKRRYLAGEWLSRAQMGRELGIPYVSIAKNCRDWTTLRKQVEADAEALEMEWYVSDRLSLLRKTDIQMIGDARLIYMKALRRILRKVPNPDKPGEMMEAEFDNDNTALAALRLASVMLHSVLLRKEKPDINPLNPLEGSEQPAIGGMGSLNIINISPKDAQELIKRYEEPELTRIIEAKNASDIVRPTKDSSSGTS